MKTELLAPAGSYECFKQALFSGADAIYLATERFGARAYAKNLSMEELKEALSLAHSLKKKIYVTVNTLIKETELEDCKNYVNTLYEYGVDGLILADMAIITYVLKNLPGMEVHISTQSGIKDLEDVSFFESIGAHRCVLARECSFEEIKKIKEKSSMPLEVFAYGALCVSYSGGCLFSSLLTLRSGNRGRCSQNCRKEYQIYKDDSLFQDFGYHLSMRDLNIAPNIKKLLDINIDSLKIEGRMKSEDYVKNVTEEFRTLIDSNTYSPIKLESVFHRKYTKGFIFHEDTSLIVDPTTKANEGAYIGKIIGKENNLTKLFLQEELKIKDRIRIALDGEDYYFTIDKLYDLNHQEISSTRKSCFVVIYKNLPLNSKIYKMIDSSIDLNCSDTYKLPLSFYFYGKEQQPLVVKTFAYGKEYIAQSKEMLLKASTKPINKETLKKQFSKLKDTVFIFKDLHNEIEGDCFMTISSINELRRNLIENIMKDLNPKRKLPVFYKEETPISYEKESIQICCKCSTKEQYEAIKELGIEDIYYENVVPYVNAKYIPIVQNTILAGNYGAISFYHDKKINADYSFNAMNSEAIYALLKAGCSHVCLSLEMDMNLIKETVTSFFKKYGWYPPLEMVVYGHQNLMTMKYCPLKKYGECGQCRNHSYFLKDSISKFPLIHKDCITHILNDKALNLIDELKLILPYVPRIRLDFTIESKEETKRILKNYLNKIKNLDDSTSYFDNKKNTRGYFKRPIL